MRNLTRQKICFLQWLCENGGRRAIDGNADFSEFRHLEDAGYIEVKPNRFSANILYLTITAAAGRRWRLLSIDKP